MSVSLSVLSLFKRCQAEDGLNTECHGGIAVKVFSILLLLASSLIVNATPYVTNVVARQRLPWNGVVDVSYEIVGDFSVACPTGMVPEMVVSAVLNGKTYTALNLGGDASSSEGRHSCWWDLTSGGVKCHSHGAVFTVSCRSNYPLYCVIDLSSGAEAESYDVSYLNEIPSGGWTDEYKTTKLVMRRCPAGADPLGRYTLTKAFYAGVFEVTQKQWYLVMGNSPSGYGGDTRPMVLVSYDAIRGSDLGSQWPASDSVDLTSFVGKLRARAGLPELDLPTEAQWEYACRACTTTTYNLGDDESALAAAGWYNGNANDRTHLVGQKTPNAWGLYDMHGNVWEWCLDWGSANLTGNDPVGAASGWYRIYRGGSWIRGADCCTSSHCGGEYPFQTYSYLGFRLFRTLP